MPKTALFLAAALCLVSSPLSSRGRGEDTGERQLAGRLFLTGNVPHTFLVLEDSGGALYRLTGEAVEELTRNSQGRTAVLRGRVVRRAAGPGLPAEFLVTKVLEIRQ
ncbi:MAG: hypothetical protein LBP69_10280 [Treponema sp.]|nr:hypothetical protein [Treponema sp.]